MNKIEMIQVDSCTVVSRVVEDAPEAPSVEDIPAAPAEEAPAPKKAGKKKV